MAIGVHLQLYDASGSPMASQSGIQACWWDVLQPKDLSSPIGKTSAATTDASGYLDLDLSNVTGLSSGDYGFLLVYKLDGTDHRDSPVFAGKVQISSISSGVDMYYYDSGWTRPSSWLSMPSVVSTDQKFVGLHAVYEDSNFVALSASGNYTVDWGDGTSPVNTSAGVTTEYDIPYANVAGNTDVGIASAVAVTFTDSGDTVNLTAHGFQNGQKVAFSTITSTTGISTYTTYFVVNKTANNFQIAASINGSALALTTDGSGNAYVPKYRQVLVTVTMQSGQTLTALNLHIKHSTSLLQSYTSGFLDIVIAGSSIVDLRIGVQTPGSFTQTINFRDLETVSLLSSDLRQWEQLFYVCTSLQQISSLAVSSISASSSSVTFTDSGDVVNWTAHPLRNGDSVIFTSITSTTGISANTRYFVVGTTTNTFQISTSYGGSALALTTDGSGVVAAGTNFSSMFSNCTSLQSIPLLNTAAGTNFNSMFSNCASLQSIPLLNTAAGTNFNSMFNSCYSLQSIPLLNTAAGTNFSSMFSNCASLQSIPLLNTAAGTDFGSMFNRCRSLQSIPLLNTAAGTNFNSMFSSCYSLQSIPLLNTAAGTNFSSMFSNCTSLQSIPLLNTAAGTDFGSMFSGCYSLQSIPLLNTAAGTNFGSMFNSCRSLQSIPLLNTAAGTNFNSMFSGCTSLQSIPLLNTAAGTTIKIGRA